MNSHRAPKSLIRRSLTVSLGCLLSIGAAVLGLGPSAGAQQVDRHSQQSQLHRRHQPPRPLGIPGGWRLAFDSEFESHHLDTSQWSTGWAAPGAEPPQAGITAPVNAAESECYDPRQVAVSGGELRLTAVTRQETCGGVTRPYASGMVNTNTKFNFTYGVAEARIWVPGERGGAITDWPAFWLDGLTWPQDGESDVLEGLGGQACYHYHGPEDNGAGYGGCSTQAYTGGWHTFAVNWEPGSVSFYYDGIKQWTDTTEIASAPQYLILDLAVDPSIGGANQIPATMQVDYVRVWQRA